MLSPQHVDKCLRNATDGRDNLKEVQDSDGCIIMHKKYDVKSTTSIMLSDHTNTSVLRSTPDNFVYNAYCVACKYVSKAADIETTAMSTEIVEKSDDDEVQLIPKIDRENNNITELIYDGNDALVASSDKGELLR